MQEEEEELNSRRNCKEMQKSYCLMNFHNIDINNNVPTKKIVIFAELVPRHAASFSAKV